MNATKILTTVFIVTASFTLTTEGFADAKSCKAAFDDAIGYISAFCDSLKGFQQECVSNCQTMFAHNLSAGNACIASCNSEGQYQKNCNNMTSRVKAEIQGHCTLSN